MSRGAGKGGARLTSWSLVYEGFDAEVERRREALCALGNGQIVTRGADCAASRDDSHYPGTYRAGLYDRSTSVVDGAPLEHEDLVNLPNWLGLSFESGDDKTLTLISHRQELDLARGVLVRESRLRHADGRVTAITERRIVHMREPRLAGLTLQISPEGWSGPLRVRAWTDGRVENRNVANYRGTDGPHLGEFEASRADGGVLTLHARTLGTKIGVAVATRTRVRVGEVEVLGRPDDVDRGAPGWAFDCVVPAGETVTVEKTAAIYTDRDWALLEPASSATRAVVAAPEFSALFTSHARAWDALWWRFALAVGGQEGTAATLRLHMFHVLQTVSPNSVELDAGVPARGWHGEGYRGHVFWDELFVFPLLAYRLPELVRALLLYRYRRLPEARLAARAAGLRGAMFPWRSASDGRDVTDRRRLNPRTDRWIADHSHLQRHISAAVAYNVWHYHEVTGDTEFLAMHGAEMLVEIARFWASIAELDPMRQRYVIRGVVGPDEFHEAYPDATRPGIDNNAYTNVMAVWSLQRAREALDALPAECRGELTARLALEDHELELWQDITRRMFVPFRGDGILDQFEGYEALKELDWAGYRARYGDIHRLDDILDAEGDSPDRYRVSKQADVLMLFYLLSGEELREILTGLGYAWDDGLIARNTDDYLRRTTHGSTLSRVVHAWVMARCDRVRSWDMLCSALGSDLVDIQRGTTAEGLHMGAMAGTVDMFQRCYTGLEARGGVLRLAPRLPAAVDHMHMRIRHRGAWIELEVERSRLRVRVAEDAPHTVTLVVDGVAAQLEPGGAGEFEIREE